MGITTKPRVQDDVTIPQEFQSTAQAVYTEELDFLDESVAETTALLERAQADTRAAIGRESRIARRLGKLKERRSQLFESMDRAFPQD